MSTKTGGPAFASGYVRRERVRMGDASSDWVTVEYHEPVHTGLSARDYFAAKAMQELVGLVTGENWQIAVAKQAYIVADEMLKERDAK